MHVYERRVSNNTTRLLSGFDHPRSKIEKQTNRVNSTKTDNKVEGTSTHLTTRLRHARLRAYIHVYGHCTHTHTLARLHTPQHVYELYIYAHMYTSTDTTHTYDTTAAIFVRARVREGV